MVKTRGSHDWVFLRCGVGIDKEDCKMIEIISIVIVCFFTLLGVLLGWYLASK